MKQKKLSPLWTIILYCVCAIIWDINVIVDLTYGATNTFTFYLHIICAVLWNISSFFLFRHYKKSIRNSK